MRALHRLFLPSLLLLTTTFAIAQQNYSDIDSKVDALLKQMTLEEKAGQLTQLAGKTPESLQAIRDGKVGSLLGVLGADNANEAQRAAVEHSRLKIPLILGFDVIHGYRTVFPVPIASTGSFDMPLLEQAERVAAKEATASGVKWVFAPMLDIARDPRWGRIVEGIGEDPYLGSMVAAAKVRGFQGKSMADPDSVVACAKHYVAYGAAEGGRDYNTVDISEQLLREIYLPPFKGAVDAGIGTFMSSFQDLNGVPGVANHHTLTDILRDEWKFNGFVVSDWGAVHELLAHGFASDDADAAAKALHAGVDMDMVDNAFEHIPELVRSGKLPESVLDEAVRRVLRVKFEAGLFDHPYADPNREKTDILNAENLQVARKLAQESMVLLQNRSDVLPLAKNKMVAVIGPLADDKASQLGPWAGNGQAVDAVSPLEGIAAKIGKEHVLYAKGIEIPSFEGSGAGAGVATPAPPSATGVKGIANTNKPASIDDAVAAAKKADVVVLFLGELAGMTGEASSRASLDFPGDQLKLANAVLATKKPVVLVVESGRPLDIRWATYHTQAILQAWFPGVQAGNAIADVLFGDASPSGRLAISWPRTLGEIPIYYNHRATGRPGSPDRWHTGYLDLPNTPLFPFGFGLTYSKFTYGDLSVKTPSITPDGTVQVSAELTNTGSREATEVVQLYVHDRVGLTSRPVRELKGFKRVTLRPGEHKTVDFSVKANDLGSYDPQMHWVVNSGTYDVWVAPDSASGVQGTFEVK